jgi:hypothetical protein
LAEFLTDEDFPHSAGIFNNVSINDPSYGDDMPMRGFLFIKPFKINLL